MKFTEERQHGFSASCVFDARTKSRHGRKLHRMGRAAAAFFAVFCTITVAQSAQQRDGAGAVTTSARRAAPVDFTGYWVAQVTEDWRWRMMTPPRGDYMGVPLNDAGRKVANAWNFETDAQGSNACKAYGAGGLMRRPLRVHITWADDNTLQLETDAGRQTRLFRFGPVQQPLASRSLQGSSVATWTHPAPEPLGTLDAPGDPDAPPPPPLPGARRLAPPPPRGHAAPASAVSRGGLKVVTTNLEAGYLRSNGVPYSEQAVVTEYYDRVSLFGSDYLQLVTVVQDPTFLTTAFIVSNQFKRETDGSKWAPTPCTIDPPAAPPHKP